MASAPCEIIWLKQLAQKAKIWGDFTDAIIFYNQMALHIASCLIF